MKRLITALFVITIATVILGCNRDAGLTPPPPVEVIVCKPVKEKIEDWDTYTGTVEAKAPVNVRANPRVQGEIKQVLFTEGEEIEADKLLFLIDDAPFQADLEKYKGELTTWTSKLKKAEATVAIREPLAKAGTIAKEELVDAIGAKGEALGAVETANGKIAEAENNIKYSKVTSSIAGKIGLALLTKGNMVNAGGTDSLLATIIPVDPLYVYFYVNQQALLNYQAFLLKKFDKDKQAGKVEIPVKMSVEGGASFPFKGVIDFLDNKVDKNTGTVKVRARFDNPKGPDGRRKLSPGMFAHIRVAIGDPYMPILLANRAILPDQSLNYVLVVNKAKENKVERVDVIAPTRLQPDGMRVVESGLTGDEWVIVEGVNRVRPGVVVSPTEGKMPRRPVGK